MFRTPSKNFWHRTIFGILFITVASFIIGFSHTPQGSVVFLIAAIFLHTTALREYISFCKQGGHTLATKTLLIFSNLYLVIRYLCISSPELGHLLPLTLILGAISTTTSFFGSHRAALTNLALTAFGFLLVTLPLGFLIDVNFTPQLVNGTHTSFWLIWLLIITKGSDLVAYLAGKTLGKHPIAPTLSPKKTIEGAVFGLLAAATFSVLLALLYRKAHPVSLSLDAWALLGLVTACIAILGDLSESLLKRSTGVKDSAAIPGLGGTLDILDSLIFTSPMLYFYLTVTEVIIT